MGGTITMGDLNGDGRVDAFVAGCCYGMNAREAGYDGSNAPSVSWVWINDGTAGALQKGHILAMDSLDGNPIRQAALGDLDEDGDLDAFAAVGAPIMGTSDSLGNLILLNDGTGKLTRIDQSLGDTDSTSVALGDVNGDGRLDALVGTSDGARLWINPADEAGSGGRRTDVKLRILPDDAIICSRLHGSLSARCCAARQQLARLRPSVHVQCRSCDDGLRFAEAAGLNPRSRDLLRDAPKHVERQARAGRHAHQAQGPGSLLDEEEAA